MILILLFLAVTNPRTNLIPISYFSLASSGSSFISSQVIVLKRRTLFETRICRWYSLAGGVYLSIAWSFSVLKPPIESVIVFPLQGVVRRP